MEAAASRKMTTRDEENPSEAPKDEPSDRGSRDRQNIHFVFSSDSVDLIELLPKA